MLDYQAMPAHSDLAEALYDALGASGEERAAFVALQTHIMTLSVTGNPSKARDLLVATESQSASEPLAEDTVASQEDNDTAIYDFKADEMNGEAVVSNLPRAWSYILEGFTREDNETEIRRTLKMASERGIHSSRRLARVMLEYSLQRDDREGAVHWWQKFRELHASIAKPSPIEIQSFSGSVDKLLQWCLRSEELELGHGVVKELMTSNPRKPVWDAILVWAAGTKNSVDEIARMLDVMEQSNASIPDPSQRRLPDITTINALVSFAISRDDPYMAERFIALGRDRYIEPDARTYVLQMDYRLGVGDVDGSLVAYKNLQGMDLSNNEDVPTVNRLLVALCRTQRHDFDTIMNVAADLSDRRVRFEPDAVSALSLLHLQRGENHDVTDLLNTHAFHYSSTDRTSIRDAILQYTLNADTPTTRAWDAYMMLRSIFDEMPREERTELMTSFFRRERPDMGVHIFQNMRQHSRADTIPTIDTYVSAFMGLAKLRDLESLEVVHNQLKLDYNINLTTYLYNALIIGYTACGSPRRALDFWNDIVVSSEGPSYNSLHIALRACEKAPFGDLKAKEIFSLLRRRGVEIDQALWSSYVAALVGNGDNEAAFAAVGEAVEKGEVEVDAFMLGSLMAGAAGQVKQEEIEAWARQRYPGPWEDLENWGVEVDELLMRRYKIDRTVSP
jgi:hypothetical protein